MTKFLELKDWTLLKHLIYDTISHLCKGLSLSEIEWICKTFGKLQFLFDIYSSVMTINVIVCASLEFCFSITCIGIALKGTAWPDAGFPILYSRFPMPDPRSSILNLQFIFHSLIKMTVVIGGKVKQNSILRLDLRVKWIFKRLVNKKVQFEGSQSL